LIHHYGGISLNLKDKVDKDANSTALDYKCKKISQVLSKYKAIHISLTQV
jgi:hypothetical protein